MRASVKDKIEYSGFTLAVVLALGSAYFFKTARDNEPQTVRQLTEINTELTRIVNAAEIYMKDIERVATLAMQKNTITESPEYVSERRAYEEEIRKAQKRGTLCAVGATSLVGLLIAYSSIRKTQG